MNPYERQMLVQHQTSSLLRDADAARLARDARRAGSQPFTELVTGPSVVDRLRSSWTSVQAHWQHGVAQAGAAEADVTAHIASLSMRPGRPA
jgi:hypothetical protein